jgi:hypothetical protein
MTFSKWVVACVGTMAICSLISCGDGGKSSKEAGSIVDTASVAQTEDEPIPPTTSTDNDAGGTYEGEEKVKPEPGKGNVQGVVMYNGKPVENIEVMLCEKFNRFLGGCDGKSYTAKTNKNGEYVIANVEPMEYGGLLAKVFDTDSYIFATSGIAGISSTTYKIVADKTLFVSPTNLFKSDLKVTNPKAGAKVAGKGLELKWEPYPDAAYYKFSLYPDSASVTSPYINQRVDATSFTVDQPLPANPYRLEVAAYNSADQKLSVGSDDLNFTVTDGAAP